MAKEIIPHERIAMCYRRIIPGQKFVKVYKTTNYAHYGGLVTCGSVWQCPVCSARICERKRVELVKATERWKASGGLVLLGTQTAPHRMGQPLKQCLSMFTRSRFLLRHRKPWKRIAAGIGLAGTVRALEVTYGENGWHVHAHELMFLRPGEVDPRGLQEMLLEEWKKACVDSGLPMPNHHGLQIDDGSKAAKYASKWGMEDELTKAHVKTGKGNHWTPWDFLRLVDQGDMQGVPLFTEYAKAFKGRRQLVWSEGLRDLLGLGKELTDEEIAAQVDEGSILLGMLTRENWDLVLRADKRGELLEAAAAEGWGGVLKFISDLMRKSNPMFCQAHS